MFILEDVVVIIVLVWDVGVVVVFGEVQFEYCVFGVIVLNGIDCIQVVCRFFNSLVFVVVCIWIVLLGCRFSILCVNVGSVDGEVWKILVFQVIYCIEEDCFFVVGVEVRMVVLLDIQVIV